jgi:hypothetical protein
MVYRVWDAYRVVASRCSLIVEGALRLDILLFPCLKKEHDVTAKQ